MGDCGDSKSAEGLVHLLMLSVAAAMLQLGGCARSSVEADGPPGRPPDLSGLVEPVPRAEPASRYGNPASYQVFGQSYRVSATSAGYRARGDASWYGTKFHGRRTSSGEPYDMYALTAAHKTLPIPTHVRVTNLENGRSIVVRVNDRGPFHVGRIIDMSYAAAAKLGILGAGTAPVEVAALPPYQSLGPNGTRVATTQATAVAAASPTGPAAKPAKTVAAADRSVPTSGSRDGRAHYLQVGAFRQLDNAERLRSDLARKLPGLVAIHTLAGEIPTYRVRVGPLRDRSSVQDATAQLVTLGHIETQLITLCDEC